MRNVMRGTNMKIRLVFPLLIASVALLMGCSTLPSSFSTENVMKIHQGMSSDEILAMFGKPKSVSAAVCGSATGAPWNCTTWECGEFPYDRASFTFSGDHGSLRLNDFKVDRK
jgi:hypothetical protein